MERMLRHRTRRGRLPYFLSLVATFAVAGCTGHGAVKQDVAGSNGYVPGNLALTYVSAEHRHTPSAVTCKLLDGSSFDLSAARRHGCEGQLFSRSNRRGRGQWGDALQR